MGEFFHGWRRKIGVVTLVIACLFIGGWVRSCFVTDTVSWGTVSLMSMDGVSTIIAAPELVSRLPEWEVEEYLPVEPDSIGGICRWQWLGFRYYEAISIPGTPTQMLIMFPYSSIAIPLTLVSVYLLLSKPRQSTQKKIIDPTAT